MHLEKLKSSYKLGSYALVEINARLVLFYEGVVAFIRFFITKSARLYQINNNWVVYAIAFVKLFVTK